jgi:hypothetical protein
MGTKRAGERRPGALTRGAEALEAGAAAGMIGGCAMLTFLVVYALATGRGVLEPLQWFGSLFYRSGAQEAGFSSAFWGLVIHLGVSSALGVPFAALVGGDTDPMAATAAGIVYGLFAWLVLTFVVLPIVDPTMAHAVAQAPIAWFAAHVPYGATLSLADQFRAGLDARERRLQHA